MKVFISWSGERSRAVAEALRDWLPKVIQELDPWISSVDIEKGAMWPKELAERLDSTDFGIICATIGNQDSRWLQFEAGSLAKAVDRTHIVPLLIGMDESSLLQPLSLFQAAALQRDDIARLLTTVNKALGTKALPEKTLEESFQVWWPKLEERLAAIPSDDASSVTKRSEGDLLEEILGIVRSVDQRLPPLAQVGSGLGGTLLPWEADALTRLEELTNELRRKRDTTNRIVEYIMKNNPMVQGSQGKVEGHNPWASYFSDKKD